MKQLLALKLFLLCAALAATPALAVTPPIGDEAGDTQSAALAEIQAALAAGDLDAAEKLLNATESMPATRNQLDFLYGLLKLERRDYAGAITYFYALLERDSSLNRVRLELARAYFLQGEDRAATYYFQAALVQGVPPTVERGIETFLDAIRRRKHWEADVFLAVVPDTNINASTAAQNVDIFGLPFELSDTARRQSGIGVALNLNASYQWPLNADTRLRFGGTFYDTEYSKRIFTDRQIGLYTGPRFQISKDTEMSVLATASRRWYGEVPLTTGGGGRVEVRSILSPRWLVDGAFTGQYLHYNAARYSSYTGPVYGLTGTVTYALSTLSLINATAGVLREQTAVSGFRNYQYTGGAGYYREGLPGRFVVFGGMQANVAQYDAALGAFATARRDLELSYRLSLSNKYFGLFGFRPVLSFVHTDRTSNIPLYSYHRNRGEIGIARNY